MVFDFNAWNLKWRDSNNHEEMEYYWNKLQEAKEDFKDDWRMFLESYNDPTHILRINYEFLDEKIEEILEKKLFIPPEFRYLLFDRYPKLEENLFENRRYNSNNNYISSVNAIGLKPLRANAIYKEDEKRLLLFEVAEFTFTYPEYEDLFIEEIIK